MGGAKDTPGIIINVIVIIIERRTREIPCLLAEAAPCHVVTWHHRHIVIALLLLLLIIIKGPTGKIPYYCNINIFLLCSMLFGVSGFYY